MKIEKEFRKKFISKLSESLDVGVEIEMPLINCNKPYKVENHIVQLLFKELLNKEFIIDNYDNDGNIIALRNVNNGDVISLEYSLNTLEFSLNKENNIYKLEDKFKNYYSFINNYLKQFNYKLCDTGVNPNYKKIDKSCLNQDRYKIIEKLLLNEENLLASQFCAYCCSIQTHINVSKDNVVNLFNIFTLISRNKDSMFSNSYIDEFKQANSRKYLWYSSNFGPLNVGENKIFSSVDDIVEDYLERNLFYVERNNKFYLLNKKYTLKDYIDNDKIEIIMENGKTKKVKPYYRDFENFRSYKDVELTKYGTLEIRTDCTQKIDNMFKLVAFNVGISYCIDEIIKYIKENKIIDNDKLIEFSIEGLKKRNNNEELLLIGGK